DLNNNLITGFEEDLGFSVNPDAAGRAGQDDVAGFEGDGLGDVLDQVIDAKDELAGVGFLTSLAVDATGDFQSVGVVDLVRSDKTGATRARTIETLRACPLLLVPLQRARADVVCRRVARDMLQRVALSHVLGGL